MPAYASASKRDSAEEASDQAQADEQPAGTTGQSGYVVRTEYFHQWWTTLVDPAGDIDHYAQRRVGPLGGRRCGFSSHVLVLRAWKKAGYKVPPPSGKNQLRTLGRIGQIIDQKDGESRSSPPGMVDSQ